MSAVQPILAPGGSALDRPITWTKFFDQTGRGKEEHTGALREIGALARDTTAAVKDDLPWIKLATFGDQRSPKGDSLRNNANVLSISGVEGDYDAGEITPAEAAGLMKAAGLAGLIYTSPSHMLPGKGNRWRVICPTAATLPPAERYRLTARLNGALGGVLANESFAMSQAFYYGSVNSNPEHHAILVEGRFIDLAHDLDAGAIGKKGGDKIELPDLPKGLAPDATATEALRVACAMFEERSADSDNHNILLIATLFVAPFVLSGHLQFADVVDELSAEFIGREPNAGEVESALKGALDKAREYCPPEPLEDVQAFFAASPPPNPMADFLSIGAWASRDIPASDRLLGDLVTTTTRIFLVGRTGLGKTQLALGMALAMATGTDFLHWRAHRKARVLIIDGEMPAELIKSRAVDARRRGEAEVLPGYLTIYARDLDEDFAKAFPKVGTFEPLNTEAGHRWVKALLDELDGIDVVIFDNVMSLTPGDQKDEMSWAGAQTLVQALTARRVGQIWLDHKGHTADHQYGSSTKAWRFDAVGNMNPLPAGQVAPDEMAFTLSFDAPGKARRRTPDNWRDFETRTIRLRGDEWTSEGVAKVAAASGPKLKPSVQCWLDVLGDVLAKGDGHRTTRSALYAEATEAGIAKQILKGDSPGQRDAKRANMRQAISALKRAKLISEDGVEGIILGSECDLAEVLA
jgi:hypothetical protein